MAWKDHLPFFLVKFKQEAKKFLTIPRLKSIFVTVAEVAELVDALGSGSSGRMLVGVRLSPSAPYYIYITSSDVFKACDLNRLAGFFVFSLPFPSIILH